MHCFVSSHPSEIAAPVKESLKGITAFFPGGNALLDENNDTFPDIMILGQDFETLDEFEQMNNHRERKSQLGQILKN